MELYTLARHESGDSIRFEKSEIIDEYESFIWTERFYGDGDVEINLPSGSKILDKLHEGTFLSIDESKEMMIVETLGIKDKKLKTQGISVLPWLNNRFIRNNKSHKVQEWIIEDTLPGVILWQMIRDTTFYLKNSSSTNIHDLYLPMLKLPDLGLYDHDLSGDPVTVSVSFDKLYDEMRKIAETFTIGMQILMEPVYDEFPDPPFERPLGFKSYKGVDRTSAQTINSVVRFSHDLDTLTDDETLRSQANYKTICFAFASNLDADLGKLGASNAGIAVVNGMGPIDPDAVGFNVRAMQLLIDDLTGYPDPLSTFDIDKLINLESAAAKDVLKKAALIKAVDGTIVSTHAYQYGRDYFLGDLIEIEGEDGTISTGRVMEYIRVKDAQGERGYPTLALIEAESTVNAISSDDLGPPLRRDYDSAGNARLLEANKGRFRWTNIDCTTDGHDPDTGNSDWLVNIWSIAEDLANWHTAWFKWAVPDEFDDDSIFKASLSDYNSHMILLLLTPEVGAIPDPDNPPSHDQATMVQFLGDDITGKGEDPPYGKLHVIMKKNWWTDDTYERWIYIGVAAPPLDVANQTQDHGGDFVLHWEYTP